MKVQKDFCCLFTVETRDMQGPTVIILETDVQVENRAQMHVRRSRTMLSCQHCFVKFCNVFSWSPKGVEQVNKSIKILQT